MKILFVGDVFGSAGRKIVREHLAHVRKSHEIDLTIVNGENAAGGFGITPNLAEDLFDLGADVITTGNHVWDKREIMDYMKSVPADSHDRPRRILRPANLQHGLPGYGVYEGVIQDGPSIGEPYAVINIMGRVFINATNDPFEKIDRVLAEIQKTSGSRIIFVDFHAEATSEKVAMGWHLDGRVTAMIGTHTHVPTADERVLPGGTAYQTDAGMSGPFDSVIGVEKDLVLARFRTGMSGKFEAATGNPKMCAVVVSCDPMTGKAYKIQRLMLGE